MPPTHPSPPLPSPSTLPTPLPDPWNHYTYTPTERTIFQPSPYKDLLLPLWRFATPATARTSAEQIYGYFLAFEEAGDFVGADNARKFLQMGMTRAARYANHKGGRKYVKGEQGKRRKQKKEVEEEEEEEQGEWKGRKEKREASEIFRGYWEKAKGSAVYQEMKEDFVKKQKERAKAGAGTGKSKQADQQE